MHLAEIWRYPVKSMAGESLVEAELTSAGVEGDRVFRCGWAVGPAVDPAIHWRAGGQQRAVGRDSSGIWPGSTRAARFGSTDDRGAIRR